MTGPSAVTLAERPGPSAPRPYEFPPVVEHRLSNGMRMLAVDMAGRPLVSASLVMLNGAVDEPADVGGATVLAARALSEGTERYDAIELTEASERLGASLHAEAGWDALSAGVDVPRDRLEGALELLAEMVLHPTFPEREVDRLRDERLNDLLQARADPRRRSDEAFVDTIYASDAPYHRPAGGTRETVAGLGPAQLRRAYERGLDPARATFIVGGELAGLDVRAIVERLFGDWTAFPAVAGRGAIDDSPAQAERVVRVIHRPGAVQSEIRIGHRGLPRRIPDFHAVSVMSAILGGLFNSRLNMNLREDKGYTYGAGAGFDLRRGAGPFSARAAVNTEVTVPAITETLKELARMRDEAVTDAELRAARDFLVGVFPLRFETAGAVVGALAGLVVHDLGIEELIGYRSAIEGVSTADVAAAARAHLLLDAAAIVVVGDADAFGPALEAAGVGPVVVERDEGPVAPGPIPEDTAAAVDEEDEIGPTAGAEEPDLPGTADEQAAVETDLSALDRSDPEGRR
jgi:predicted Zn-dependent peptidase